MAFRTWVPRRGPTSPRAPSTRPTTCPLSILPPSRRSSSSPSTSTLTSWTPTRTPRTRGRRGSRGSDSTREEFVFPLNYLGFPGCRLCLLNCFWETVTSFNFAYICICIWEFRPPLVLFQQIFRFIRWNNYKKDRIFTIILTVLQKPTAPRTNSNLVKIYPIGKL